jgi:NitT/TauT family transport system ATP-binding protein
MRLIHVENLAKRYVTRRGESVDAIDSISFDVADGEFISFVGPSGCGKTTLLNMLGGLIAPSGGTLLFGGLPGAATRPRLGMVFQDAVLLPWRTVLQNVLLPVEVMSLEAGAGEKRAQALIELVGLAGFENSFPFELSGGMQQRASIARALVHEPALMLMDEPFAALDALTRESMAAELQRIWMSSRKTVLFVTHSISEAAFLSDRVVVLSDRPSRIKQIVSVDLPRPRTLEMTLDPAFVACTGKIRSSLQAQAAF